MNNNLLFDFKVDKTKKTVTITREFNAELSMVWQAFTDAEILDQWNAPQPFRARTKYQDFEVGGKRMYAMISPDGLERWIIQEYKSITPKTHFSLFNCFSDEHENLMLPGSDWDYTFNENNGITKVDISIYNESLERMELMIEMGFKEGFTVSLNQLDLIFENQT